MREHSRDKERLEHILDAIGVIENGLTLRNSTRSLNNETIKKEQPCGVALCVKEKRELLSFCEITLLLRGVHQREHRKQEHQLQEQQVPLPR